MPIIGEPGTQVVNKPDVWEIDGFSFHNQMQPVEVVQTGDGVGVSVRAYAMVEVVAGVRLPDGTMSEVTRQSVRIDGSAFMEAIARNPELYAEVTMVLYQELQLLGYVPAEGTPVIEQEKSDG